MHRQTVALVAFVFALAITPGCATTQAPGIDWRVAGGEPGNSRYSALEQINRSNVARLRVAWTSRTGDHQGNGQIQATPIVVDGVLYTTTPALSVVALRADSGTLIALFVPLASRATAPS